MNKDKKLAPSFMVELVERTAKHFHDSNKQVEDSLKPHRADMEIVARNIERVAKIYQSTYGIDPDKNLDEIKKGVSNIVENREFVPSSTSSVPQEKLHTVSLSQKDKDELVEAVAKKVLELSSHAIKTKKDALFAKSVVDLPENAHWENLTLQFTDSENIEVLYKDTKTGIYNCDAIGFAKNDKGERTPTKAWKFLLSLSLMDFPDGNKKETEEYQPYEKNVKRIYPTNATILHDEKMGFSQKNTIEKRKSELSKRLRAAFGIDEEPFHPYDKEYGYTPKFKLYPPLGLRGDGDLRSSGGEFYDETYDGDDENEDGINDDN